MSTLTELSTESGHRIKFDETEVLAKTSGYMDRLVEEATEIKLCPGSINRGSIHTHQGMKSNHQVVKALQHTYITKVPRRHREEHTRKNIKYLTTG
jgi:hypothetical protein